VVVYSCYYYYYCYLVPCVLLTLLVGWPEGQLA